MPLIKKLRGEDDVRNNADTILGFSDGEANVNQGTGQMLTFKRLGYANHPLKDHKPDGWYIPDDKGTAMILEAKDPGYDLERQEFIDEVLKNCAVLATTHRNVIGILYNGKKTELKHTLIISPPTYKNSSTTSAHLLTVSTTKKETHPCLISQNLTNPSKTSATS